MKLKLVSVFLLVVMYLNIMGYYWVLVGLHYNSAVSLERKLNADDYLEQETVTFRFHLTIPYSAGERGFERAEGQFEYNGDFYHLVKQQYVNDSLHLVCVKNHETKRISRALNDYVKTFADHEGAPSKSVRDIPGFIKDFLPHSFAIASSATGWSHSIQFGRLSGKSTPPYLFLIPRPPQIA